MPGRLAEADGLVQLSDPAAIDPLVVAVLRDHPAQVDQYLAGKKAVGQWLFGQVMRAAGGRAKPSIVQQRLTAQLEALEKSRPHG
jgi:aspartyl-tRNA(Asn)/glutamyl-tRNA(Gln) amidotransferase subunit B